jgi:ATP-binding cassette, subfamily B, bacterial
MISLKLILSYFVPPIKKYKWSFLFTFVFYGVGNLGMHTIVPLFYREIVDIMSSTESTIAIASTLMTLVLAIAIVIVTYNISLRLGDYLAVYSQSNILRELHNYSFQKLQNHSYQFFASTFQGSLVAKAKRYARSFESLHDQAMYSFWPIAIQLSGVFVVLFVLVPTVASVLALWCVIYLLITLFLVHKKRKFDLLEAEADSLVIASFADTITNILNIKMFATKRREISTFANITHEEESKRRAAWLFNNYISIVQAVLWLLLEVIGIYIVVNLWIDGVVSTGTVVLVQVYFGSLLGNMWNLGHAISYSIKALSDTSEIVEIFELPLGIVDPKNPERSKIQDGHIVFKNVSFTYGDSVSVFKDLNLNISAKEKIGLVGYSGVGKTTITKLLLRFVDVRSGVISIDGQDISSISQDDLRSKIAYVPQDPVLFHRSLRENIAYANPNASEEEIVKVARKAHVHEFISKLPQGYDTLVGERGVNLSGGERQRVAIARAMLKEAPILILDEATSSLDSISEQLVQDAFAKLMEGRTTIVIAHRLSTVKKMDRIIVLADGRIAEEGSHEELLNKKGVYYDFWTHQSGGFIS